MAAATAENLNGVLNGFQWSPGICRQLRIYPLVSPLFLRVGRIRCQAGTHRFHRSPPVRNFQTVFARLNLIV